MRVFSSREHTRALSAGDVFAVVGWSGDLLPLAERINDIVLVAPASGTALWADMWAVPWQAQNGSKVGSAAPRPRFHPETVGKGTAAGGYHWGLHAILLPVTEEGLVLGVSRAVLHDPCPCAAADGGPIPAAACMAGLLAAALQGSLEQGPQARRVPLAPSSRTHST